MVLSLGGFPHTRVIPARAEDLPLSIRPEGLFRAGQMLSMVRESVRSTSSYVQEVTYGFAESIVLSVVHRPGRR